MLKYIFLLLLSLNILNAEEDVVKTSELELFLFKVGFESLLKDVDITKDKSSLNEKEIKTINEKIELIMSELYKDKRILLNNSEDTKSPVLNKDELINLKQEILFLKEEVQKLKETQNVKVLKEEKKILIIKPKEIEIKKESNTKQMRVVSDIANVYDNAFPKSNIIKKLKRDDLISIESCDSFGWCKLSSKKEYIKRFLLK